MKYSKILLNFNAYSQKITFSQVKYIYIYFIFHCQGTYLGDKHYTTKCKYCFSSFINFVLNKKKIQNFAGNMTFISSNEVKTYISFVDSQGTELGVQILHNKMVLLLLFIHRFCT